LSRREHQIAELVAAGKRTADIAERLQISERTVEAHLAAAFNKLGINSRVELTAHVLRADKRKDEGRSRPSNLPVFLATLFGREREIQEILALVGSHRLVTLVGAGGVGKTRCALQVGADVLDAFADGVWFAELAAVSDPSSVPNVMVAVFEIQASLKRPLLDTLVAHLESKHLLVVLDNCEHVVGEVSKAAAAAPSTPKKSAVVPSARNSFACASSPVTPMCSSRISRAFPSALERPPTLPLLPVPGRRRPPPGRSPAPGGCSLSCS
jgi:DNA-binding CsgD family transcriptional regulator